MTWWGLAIGVTGNYAKNWNLDTLKTEILGQSIWLWINWPTCKEAVRMTLLATWLVRWNMHSKWFKIEKGITCRTRLEFLSIQEVCYWKETGHHKHCISKKRWLCFSAGSIPHQMPYYKNARVIATGLQRHCAHAVHRARCEPQQYLSIHYQTSRVSLPRKSVGSLQAPTTAPDLMA